MRIYGGARMLTADVQLIIGKCPQKAGAAHCCAQAFTLSAQLHIRRAKPNARFARQSGLRRKRKGAALKACKPARHVDPQKVAHTKKGKNKFVRRGGKQLFWRAHLPDGPLLVQQGHAV